jgi:hypothetical protein
MFYWLRMIGYALLVAAGITYAYIFVWIYLYHNYGCEANPLPLAIEMGMGPVIFALGIYLLIKDYRRR